MHKQTPSKAKCISVTAQFFLCRHSIHASSRQQGELREAVNSLPQRWQGAQNVYHCGYHSEASYGAASYLITREGGNVLMDSPRFDPKLLRRFQARLCSAPVLHQSTALLLTWRGSLVWGPIHRSC